jgi:multisubunit Na+/H+ antiporter MnhC subunit
MKLSGAYDTHNGVRSLAAVARGAFAVIGLLLGAALIGFAVPAFWFWVGSLLGGRHTPGVHTSPQTFAAILPGIILTYVVILDLCGRLYARRYGSEGGQGWPRRRAIWNRSMRDERYRSGQARLTPIETLFVFTTIVVGIAFQVWFLFFAGSPIPAGAPA